MATEGTRARNLNDLKDRLTELIASGQVPPGSLLPAERDLMTQFDASRHLVRHALADLQETGVVRIERGTGTRVLTAPARYTELRTIEDPAELIEPTGEPIKTRVPASPVDAGMFGIEHEDPLFILKQTGNHRVTGARVLLTRTTPVASLLRIRPSPAPYGDRAALLEALTRKHGPLVTKDRARFIATPPAATAYMLDVESGGPIAEIRRFHRTESGRLLMIEAQATDAAALEWEWDI